MPIYVNDEPIRTVQYGRERVVGYIEHYTSVEYLRELDTRKEWLPEGVSDDNHNYFLSIDIDSFYGIPCGTVSQPLEDKYYIVGMNIDGLSVPEYYEVFYCKPTSPPTIPEMKEVKYNDETVHRVSTITAYLKPSGAPVQNLGTFIGTWGVDLFDIETPSYSNQAFAGWFDKNDVRINLPIPFPKDDMEIWGKFNPAPVPGIWRFKEYSNNNFCSSPGFKLIGTSCPNKGNTRTVMGSVEGYGDSCIVLECV